MKPLFWVPKNKEGDAEIPEYWSECTIEFEYLGSMFQDLQDRFYVPKSKTKKTQKISLLSMPVANAISTYTASLRSNMRSNMEIAVRSCRR